MMNKLLTFIARFLPERRIMVGGEVYLRRYYLFGRMPELLADKWNCGKLPRQRLGFLRTRYLHCFEQPDDDRDCHCHPWVGKSRILSGGYVEDRWSAHPRLPASQLQTHERKPGQLVRLEPDTYHRIDKLNAPRVWSLFTAGEPVQVWGYWDARAEAFVPWYARHADVNADDGAHKGEQGP